MITKPRLCLIIKFVGLLIQYFGNMEMSWSLGGNQYK